MKKLFLLMLCCIFVFSFSMASLAANNKGGKQVKAKAKIEVQKVSAQPQSVSQSVYQSVYAREGFIRAISTVNSVVVVGKKNKADETLKITSFTVFKNVQAKQKTAKISDLKAGMKVLVMFDKERHATLIKILPQKAVKAPKVVKAKKAIKPQKTIKQQKAVKQKKEVKQQKAIKQKEGVRLQDTTQKQNPQKQEKLLKHEKLKEKR